MSVSADRAPAGFSGPAPRVFVVGAGIMGSGIATVATMAGCPVRLYDVSPTFVEKGLGALTANLDRAVTKGKLTAGARDEARARVVGATTLDDARDASVVVEAAPEKLELKRQIFRDLDARVPPEAWLGTNTSSLSITAIASVVKDPGRVVGIHFFNPVPAMELVELISGAHTRPETLERARSFAQALGKTVTQSKDFPGFVTTRSTAVLINEAVWMLFEGVASREDIDLAHKLGFHHPMGPLELADLVGLDTMLSVLERLYTGFHDQKYRPSPLLVNMVEAGKLGRKTGEGFYTYPPRQAPPSGTAGR